ncbi:hypothetical protein I3842_07G133300 [Carya illinoinensis]|uniref:LysM domain-containing protein n=1 Tax=Carya illinoinensis TaxID=32201 RepID=A0A922JG47_CARIL|nr:hypothetical protein I3842_07G133300 [Carya illinoinensis]
METSTLLYLIFSLFVVLFLRISHLSVEAQQTYSDRQLNCYNNINYMNGYFCNSVQLSCEAYLSFRSNFPYNSPATIGLLLGSEPSLIAEANDISNYGTIPTDTQILIPVNCSCSGPYYQYNTSYKLSGRDETYFTVANNTYQGLTTCQAMMAQNSYGDRNLTVGLNLVVPLRCACPTSNQAAAGIEYLLTYMITWGDSVSSIAELFGVEPQSILDANQLSKESLIFPFTPILIPLKGRPSTIQRVRRPVFASVDMGAASETSIFCIGA